MNFEQELQLLVTKYNLQDVEVSYKHKITLSANAITNVQKNKETVAGLVDEVDDEQARLAERYAGGPVGRLNP